MIDIITGNYDLVRFFSLVVSYGLFFITAWGVLAFFPKRDERGNTAPAWLILAIWLGFFAVFLNVGYWRVFQSIALAYGWLTVEEIRKIGNGYGDIIWKGLGVVAIYLHFFARWKAISKEEQKYWSPLMMGFYPDLSNWALRILTFWKNNQRDDYYLQRQRQHSDNEDT